jgi:hypothetical protein
MDFCGPGALAFLLSGVIDYDDADRAIIWEHINLVDGQRFCNLGFILRADQ